MTTVTSRRQPELTRQTVVVIGDGAGIVLETPPPDRRRGRRHDLDGRNPDRQGRAAAGLPEQTGRVMVTAVGPAFR